MNLLFKAIALLWLAQAPVRLAPGTGIVVGSVQIDGGGSLAGIRVAVVATDDSTVSNLVSLTETDAAGRFRLSDIPQGHYFVVAGPVNNFTYYPGGFDRAKATDIYVEAAKTLVNINFRVPSDSRRPPPPRSEAKSATEHYAYLQATNEGKSKTRIGLLLSFEKNFPQSLLLPRVYEDLVDLYSAQGDQQLAISYGNKLLEKEPENVRVLLNVSRAYGLSRTNLQTALEYGEKAVNITAKLKTLPATGRPAAFRDYSPLEWSRIVASLDESAKNNLVWVKQLVAWYRVEFNNAMRVRP